MTATTNYSWTKPDASTNVRIWEWVGTFLDQIDTSLAAEAALRTDIISKRTADLGRATNTTLTADTQITGVSLVSGATYEVKAYLFYKADPAGDFKFQWTCTGSGATFLWVIQALNLGSTGDDHNGYALSDFASVGGITASGTMQSCEAKGILFAGTGTPSFGLSWSQVSSSANGTTLLNGATVVLHRIA